MSCSSESELQITYAEAEYKNPSEGESVLKNQNRIIENLLKINDTYELKVEDMCVEMSYNENKKSFSECILNILNQKIKTG